MSNSLNVFKQDGSHQFYCRWTPEEDRLLAKAVANHGPHRWTLVAKLIPGRTSVQCSTRWSGALNPNIHKGRWSKTEDQALTEAVRFYQAITPKETSLPWNRISENIPNRTGIQCQARWTEALDPAIRKGRWLPEEDSQLKAAIAKYGCCWIRVASLIPTRTQRQCRTRWNQIHSQQIKVSPVSTNATLMTKKEDIIKYDFMPTTDMPIFDEQQDLSMFPSPPADLATFNSTPSMLPSPPTIDDIIFNQTANNLTIDGIIFNQYMDGLNSSSSSTSSRFSSFGSASTMFPITPVYENQTYENDALKYQQYDNGLSAFQYTELDLLLNCLSSPQ